MKRLDILVGSKYSCGGGEVPSTDGDIRMYYGVVVFPLVLANKKLGTGIRLVAALYSRSVYCTKESSAQ
jgi:hypothetical protein